MNKHIIFKTGLLLFISLNSFGQKFYMDVNAGYGFKLAPMQHASYSYNSSGSSSASKGVSLGSGMNLGGSLGYMLNENIGFEMGLNYFMNFLKTEHQSGYYQSGVASQTDNYVGHWRTSMLRMMPAIRFSVGSGKVKWHSKFGMVVGVLGRSVQDEIDNNEYTNLATSASTVNVYEQTWTYTGGISLGMMGSFGMEYPINEKTSLSFDATFIAQSWAYTKGTVTKCTTNGYDRLWALNTSQKEVDFVDHYSYNNGTYSSNKPSQQVKQYNALSCVSLNVGFHFILGKKKEEEKK